MRPSASPVGKGAAVSHRLSQERPGPRTSGPVGFVGSRLRGTCFTPLDSSQLPLLRVFRWGMDPARHRAVGCKGRTRDRRSVEHGVREHGGVALGVFGLSTGSTNVVKGPVTGSIICMGLLGLGFAILAGNWGRAKQTFQPRRVGLRSSLLILSMIAFLLPAFFDYAERGVSAVLDPSAPNERLSLGVSVVLIVVYVANLLYTPVTHRDVFAIEGAQKEAEPQLERIQVHYQSPFVLMI